MAIAIQCPECHKKYNAPDHMAGKRVKCKYCAVVFLVSADSPVADFTDVDLAGGTGAGAMAAGGKRKGGTADAGDEDGDPLFQAEYAAEGGPRTNKLYVFPLSRHLDQWLPPLLLAVGLMWVVREAFERNETNRAWVGVFRAAVFLAAFFASVLPFTLMALREASRKLNYELPPRPALRVLGAYAVPFALACAMWLLIGGAGGLVIGVLIGAAVALPVLFLLLRLIPRESAVTFGYATGGFVLAVAVSVAAVFALNLMLVGSLRALRTQHALVTSPFGPEFNWDGPVERARRQIAQGQGDGAATTRPDEPTTAPTTGPATGPTTGPSTPVAATGPSTATTRAAAIDGARNRSVPTERDVVRSGTTTAPVTTTDDAGPPPREGAGGRPPGGVVAGVRTVVNGPFSAAIYPAVPGPSLAVVREARAGHDRIELWNTQSWKPAGSLDVPRLPQGNRYVLSPDGQFLCFATDFPRLAVQVWSFESGRMLRQLDLDVQDGEPQVVGFSAPDQLIVRRHKSFVTTLQVWNVKAGGRPRVMELPAFDPSPNLYAIHPDGDAIAVVVRRGAGADLESYSLANGRPIKQMAIVEVNWHAGVSVAGLAYSPDGGRICAVFAQGQGAGFFVAWPAGGRGGRALAQHLLPLGVQPAAGLDGAAAFEGRPFHWLDKGGAWLLQGNSVFDTESGVLLGSLGIPGVRSQAADPAADTCHVVRSDELGGMAVDAVTLDLAAARQKALPAPGAAAPGRGAAQ